MEQRPSHWSECPNTYPSSPSPGPTGAGAGRGPGPSGRRGVKKGVWIAITVVVCVAVAAVAAYLAFSPDKEEATNTDTTSQTQTAFGPNAAAEDAAAKSLVRNAMTAIESAYVDLRTFDEATATAAMLQSVEPSIAFVAMAGAGAATAPKASTTEDAVNYSGTGDTYAVGTVSASGKTFGVTVDKRAGGGNTFYIDGAVQDW